MSSTSCVIVNYNTSSHGCFFQALPDSWLKDNPEPIDDEALEPLDTTEFGLGKEVTGEG